MNLSNEQFLLGQTAIVTGGSKRLGAVIATQLAQCGANIVIFDRSVDVNNCSVADKIRELGREVLIIRGDVSNVQDVKKVIERTVAEFSSIDILIHNAGPWTNTPLKQLAEEDWDAIMNGNLKGAFLLSQNAFPHMRDKQKGRIILLSAEGSYTRNHTVYGLAKSGINTITQTLALELAPTITVNAISPGLLYDPNIDEELHQYAAGDTPLGRIATYEEVAQMAVSICSPLFDIVTGQVVVMDGGRTILRYEHSPTKV